MGSHTVSCNITADQILVVTRVSVNKAHVDIRFNRGLVLPLVNEFEYTSRCQICAATCWVSVSLHPYRVASTMWPNMGKRDIIHKIGSA